MLPLAVIAAVVVGDKVALRAVPERGGAQQAILWKGDWLEVRGERKGWLKVYDHRHERPGWIAQQNVRVVGLEESAAPSLRAVVDFVRDTGGQESLGIAYAALYLKVTPKIDAGILVSLGVMADRLARRSDGNAAEQVQVAQSWGLRFASVERDDAVRLCYDGEAFRQALGLAPGAVDEATAVLALTDAGCAAPVLGATERQAQDGARLALLEKLDPTRLPGPLGNRVRVRRAEIGARLAWASAMRGDGAAAAKTAAAAVSAFARVDRAELADEDLAAYESAALAVAASRWAAEPEPPADKNVALALTAGEPGQTCVALREAKKCTHGQVWPASFRIAPGRGAAALAVEPLPGWLELWLFRKAPDGGWMVDILAPATEGPDLGYVELAGWSPDGARALLVREARAEGSVRRSFQVVKVNTLAVEKEASSPFATFRRWATAEWRGRTLIPALQN